MMDGITAMIKIVSFLLTRQESMPFRTPVRWREMGLHDYPLKVSRPMDLGTVKHLLEENSYRAVAEVAEDIRCVWSNCMLYNDKGSELHRTAQLLSARFEERYSRLLKQLRDVPEEILPPTGKDKRWFAENFLLLKTEDRNAIIYRLDARSPGCLQKAEGEDKLMIEIDAIGTHVFWEITDTIHRCLPDNHYLVNSCGRQDNKDSNNSSSRRKKRRRLG